MQNQPPSAPQRTLQLPLLIAIVAFALWQAFQMAENVQARVSLNAARDGQSGPLTESENIRRQFNSIVGPHWNSRGRATRMRRRSSTPSPSAA